MGTGLPVILSDAKGVTGFDFQLDYNPAMLNITAVAFGPGVPSGTLTPNEYTINSANGHVYVSVPSVAALSGLATDGYRAHSLRAAGNARIGQPRVRRIPGPQPDGR